MEMSALHVIYAMYNPPQTHRCTFASPLIFDKQQREENITTVLYVHLNGIDQSPFPVLPKT